MAIVAAPRVTVDRVLLGMNSELGGRERPSWRVPAAFDELTPDSDNDLPEVEQSKDLDVVLLSGPVEDEFC